MPIPRERFRVSRRRVVCSLILGSFTLVLLPFVAFHLFRRSPSRFPVDDHFKLLAEGTYAPPNVHALTLVVWAAPLSDPNPSFAASYQSYKSSAERILRGCGAYFVAYTSLHLVLGSPLPIHQSYPGDEEEAKQHTAFWVEALRHCDPSSFTFRVLPPQLSATGELYFPVDDITGTSLLKQCMVEHADTLAQPFLSFPDHLGIPFMRLALGRESEISDNLLEERLSLVVDTWANITQSAPPPVLHSTHAYLISGDPTISLSSKVPRSSVVGEL